MRGLIRPPRGFGVAYIDFASQEVGLAAAYSGDGRMIAAYTSGDPYLAFAKAVELFAVSNRLAAGIHRFAEYVEADR